MPRWAVPAVCALLTLPLACASGSASRGNRLVPSPDAPEWVHKTSYVDGRSMFAVGASAGVRNVGLARSRAGNRARNELAKLVEVYSASLMKDYSSSLSTGDLSESEEQQLVESVTKTFTSQLLTGVEITRFYADDNQGVLYALAELNLDRQAAIAAAKTRMGPGLKKWVEQNGENVLNGLEEDLKGQPAAPPPAPPPEEFAEDGTDDGAVGAPGKPGDDLDPGAGIRVCDDARYLCASGQGPDRESADIAARAELARIFEARIQSVAESYASAGRTISDRTGEQWIETQKFSQQSLVTTDKDMRMSRILGRWNEGSIFNSLVGINRQQAASDLRARIETQDGIVAAEMRNATEASNAVQRLKHARAAVDAFVAREAFNSDLRVIRADGRGIPSPVGMAELLGLVEEAHGELKLGIALAGPGADRVRACLEESLTEKGYEVQSRVDEDATRVELEGDFDVLLNGRLEAEERGRVRGNQLVQVRLTLRLINGKTQKTLKTITGQQKGTRPTVQAALSTAAYQLCKKKVPRMIQDIDRYFVR